MSITIYGASDDLIEVEGDISEEFSALGEDDGYLIAVSDGTLLRVRYTADGVWRIEPVHQGGADLDIVQAISADDDNYSDRATLTGTIDWVALATAWAKR